MNGINISLITPYKFFPSGITTGDGVNFQNTDNTEQHLQDWEGVYPDRWMQPVPKYWYDYSPGIDFQVVVDTSILTYSEIDVSLLDLDGNFVKALSKETILTVSTTIYARFYLNDLSFADGCYYIQIYVNQGDELYQSEILNIKEVHENCYPLDYSNFENDFGVVFDGTLDWAGKLLIPMRIFKPVPEDERETYQNDAGGLVTLRSVPKRIYEIESETVPTWFAEKVKMCFSCSELKLSKYDVNSEEAPSIEIFSESDMMEISGSVQLDSFSEDYFYNEKIDVISDVIETWVSDGATVGDWTDFYVDGSEITDSLYEYAGVATALNEDVSLVKDNWYLLTIIANSGVYNNVEVAIDGETNTIELGNNVFLIKASATGFDDLVLTCEQDSDINLLASMKKIN